MGRSRWALLLLTLVGMPAFAPASGGGHRNPTARPKVTALVCEVNVYGWGAGTVEVVGGIVAGHGWRGAEDVKGVLGKGSRLSLYALEAGPLGTVTLTSPERLGSTDPEPPYCVGVEFASSDTTVTPGKEAAYAQARERRQAIPGVCIPLLGAWMSDGREPAWITGELLSGKKESPYWNVAESWLRARGVTAKALQDWRVEQVVRADVNRDGGTEVFLSVTNGPAETPTGQSTKDTFSYLLMRRTRPGSREVETVVLDDIAWRMLWVSGFCDLNRDGWAEVVIAADGIDFGGNGLFYWDGRRYRLLWGCTRGV